MPQFVTTDPNHHHLLPHSPPSAHLQDGGHVVDIFCRLIVDLCIGKDQHGVIVHLSRLSISPLLCLGLHGAKVHGGLHIAAVVRVLGEVHRRVEGERKLHSSRAMDDTGGSSIDVTRVDTTEDTARFAWINAAGHLLQLRRYASFPDSGTACSSYNVYTSSTTTQKQHCVRLCSRA